MMHVHLVFVTKYRCARFSADQLGFLKDIFEGICKDFNAELVEMNGERDHVHLLVNYPPNVSVSKLVNSLKGVSSRMLRKQSQAGFERCFNSFEVEERASLKYIRGQEAFIPKPPPT